MTTAQRLDHVGIIVPDIDAAAADFVERLGLIIDHDEIVTSVNVRLLYLRPPGDEFSTHVQLVQPLGDGPVADFLTQRGGGLHHICLAVEDIPAALASMPGEQGVSVIKGGRGRRTCFLSQKLAGVLIEFTE